MTIYRTDGQNRNAHSQELIPENLPVLLSENGENIGSTLNIVVAVADNLKCSEVGRICQNENGLEIEKYLMITDNSSLSYIAAPEEDEMEYDRGNIQMTADGQLYQMTVTDEGIKIYNLAQISAEAVDADVLVIKRIYPQESDAVLYAEENYTPISANTVRDGKPIIGNTAGVAGKNFRWKRSFCCGSAILLGWLECGVFYKQY